MSDYMQGRTPEQQARNEQACEIIAEAIICLLVIGAAVFLVGLIAGAV